MSKDIFILDNNDSFTYNIVNHLRRMVDTTFTVKTADNFQISDLIYFDKIIISPGPGLPKDFPIIDKILKEYYQSKAILGICMGHQAIGTFFGGMLHNISPVIHGQAHEVKIVHESPLWAGIPKHFKAGLYHSWALDVDKIPDSLVVTATSENNTVMAMQSKDYPVFGVQFHPESHITEFGFEILSNFVRHDDN